MSWVLRDSRPSVLLGNLQQRIICCQILVGASLHVLICIMHPWCLLTSCHVTALRQTCDLIGIFSRLAWLPTSPISEWYLWGWVWPVQNLVPIFRSGLLVSCYIAAWTIRISLGVLCLWGCLLDPLLVRYEAPYFGRSKALFCRFHSEALLLAK